jgi:transposase
MSDSLLFVGIDVSKEHLDFALLPGSSWRSPNDPDAFGELVARLRALAPTLIVMEASGGYERDFAAALGAARLPVAVVNPRQVRHYAQALGQLAKTDRLDARVLARFAQDVRPPVRELPDEAASALEELVARRRQLREMLTAELNRRQQCRTAAVRADLDANIAWLKKRLSDSDKELKKRIESSPLWKAKEDLLKSVPGVGKVVATTLVAELPELGKLPTKALAALVGLAPVARESGKHKGERQIFGGRGEVRGKLYMAALVGVKHNRVLRAYYKKLLERGKKKKVALIACAHKLLRILNAMVKTQQPWDEARLVVA